MRDLIAIAELSDENPYVRCRAVIGLGKTHDPGALPHIIECTYDCDEHVRYEAIMAIGELADNRGIQHLMRFLELDDESVSSPAAMALCRFGRAALESTLRACADSRSSVRA